MKRSELKPGDSYVRMSDIKQLLESKGNTLLVYTIVRTAGTTDDKLLINGRELVGFSGDEKVVWLLL